MRYEPESNRTRAYRRDQIAKQKRRAAHYRTCPVPSPAWIGHIATTPKPCSCPLCGNPRRHFGTRTRQELAL